MVRWLITALALAPLAGQPAPADGVAKLALELHPERLRRVAIEPEQELGPQTGPLDRHRIGP